MISSLARTSLIFLFTLLPIQGQVFYLNNSYASTSTGSLTAPFKTLEEAFSGIQAFITTNPNANITLYAAATPQPYLLYNHLDLTGNSAINLLIAGMTNTSSMQITQDPFSVPLVDQKTTNYSFPSHCYSAYPQILIQPNATLSAGSIKLSSFGGVQIENITAIVDSLNSSSSSQPAVFTATASDPSNSFVNISNLCVSLASQSPWTFLAADSFSSLTVRNLSMQFSQTLNQNKNSQGIIRILSNETTGKIITLSDIYIYSFLSSSNTTHGLINLLCGDTLHTISEVQVNRLFSQAFIPQFHLDVTAFTLSNLLISLYNTSSSITLPTSYNGFEISLLKGVQNLTIQNATLTGFNFTRGIVLFISTNVTPTYTQVSNVMLYDNVLGCTRLLSIQFVVDLSFDGFFIQNSVLNFTRCNQFQGIISTENDILEAGNLFNLVRRFNPTSEMIKNGSLQQADPMDVNTRLKNFQILNSTLYKLELFSVKMRDFGTPDQNSTHVLFVNYKASVSFSEIAVLNSTIDTSANLFIVPFLGGFFKNITFEDNTVANKSNFIYFKGSQLSLIFEDSRVSRNTIRNQSAIIKIENTPNYLLSARNFSQIQAYEVIQITNTVFMNDTLIETSPLIFLNVFTLDIENCKIQPMALVNSSGYIYVPTGLQFEEPLHRNLEAEAVLYGTSWGFFERIIDLQTHAVSSSVISQNRVWEQGPADSEVNFISSDNYMDFFLLPIMLHNVTFWGIELYNSSLVTVKDLSKFEGLVLLEGITIGKIIANDPLGGGIFVCSSCTTLTFMESIVTTYYGDMPLLLILETQSVSLSPDNMWNLLYNMTSKKYERDLLSLDQIEVIAADPSGFGTTNASQGTQSCPMEGTTKNLVKISSKRLTNFVLTLNCFININLASQLVSINSLRVDGDIIITDNVFQNIDFNPCILEDQVYGTNLIRLDLFYASRPNEATSIYFISNIISSLQLFGGTELVQVVNNDLIQITAPKVALYFKYNSFENLVLFSNYDHILEYNSMMPIEFTENAFSEICKGSSALISLLTPNSSIINNVFSFISANLSATYGYGVFMIDSPLTMEGEVHANATYELTFNNNTFDTIYTMMYGIIYAEGVKLHISANDNRFTRILTNADGCVLCFVDCSFAEFNLTNTTFNNQTESQQPDPSPARLLSDSSIDDEPFSSLAMVAAAYTNFLNIQTSPSGPININGFYTHITPTPITSVSEILTERLYGVLFAFIDVDGQITFNDTIINYAFVQSSEELVSYDLEKIFSFLAFDTGSVSIQNSVFTNMVFQSSSLINAMISLTEVATLEITNCSFTNLTFSKSNIYQVIEDSGELSYYTAISVANGLVAISDNTQAVIRFEADKPTKELPNSLNLIITSSVFSNITFSVQEEITYGSCVMLYAGGASNLSITNSSFTKLFSFSGPAVYSQLNQSESATGKQSMISIYSSTFSENIAQFSGGVLYNTGSNLHVGNSSFENNRALTGRTSTLFTLDLYQWPPNNYTNNTGSGKKTDAEFNCTDLNYSEVFQGKYEIKDVSALVYPDILPEKPCGISPLPTTAVMFINHTHDGLLRFKGPEYYLENAPYDIFNYPIVMYVEDSVGRFFYEVNRPQVVLYTDNDGEVLMAHTLDCSKPYLESNAHSCNFTKGFGHTIYSQANRTMRFIAEYKSKVYGSYNISLSLKMRPCVPGEIKVFNSHDGSYTCDRCSTGSYSLDPDALSCNPCPDFATCPGGSLIDVYQRYSLVFVDATTTNVTVQMCPSPAKCNGGIDMNNCTEGYKGQLCRFCEAENDYIAEGDECQLCRRLGLHIAILSSVLIGIFIYQIYFIYKSYSTNVALVRLAENSNEEVHDDIDNEYAGGIYIRLLTTYSQIISVVSILRGRLFQDIGVASSMIGTPSTTVLYSSICIFVLDETFNEKYILYYNVLLVNLLPMVKIILLWAIIAIVFRKTMNSEKRWGIMWLAYTCILLVEQPGVFKQLITYFDCERLDQFNYMHRKTGTYCYDSTYYNFRNWIVYPSLAFWGVLFPAGLFVRLFTIRKELRKEFNLLIYGVMYCGYKAKAYWWEVMSILIKIVINTVAELYKDNFNLLALLIFFILFAYYSFFTYVHPYATKELNDFERMTFRAYMITIFASITYYNQTEAAVFGKFAPLLLALVINLYTLIMIVRKIAHSQQKHFDRIKSFIQKLTSRIRNNGEGSLGVNGYIEEIIKKNVQGDLERTHCENNESSVENGMSHQEPGSGAQIHSESSNGLEITFNTVIENYTTESEKEVL